MGSVFNGILYQCNPKKFEQIQQTAAGFSQVFIGRNIIQDDIFGVIENYAKTKEMPLEWLRFPIDDKELCACTFIRGGRIFVMLNSGIALSKQIFAAAHELYHIRCYLEDNDTELAVAGSILESETIDSGTTQETEMEANAFAGVLLVPIDDLEQQIRIFQINTEKIGLDDVLTLMDIFAVPFKAMVFRLLEAKIISDEQTQMLLSIPTDEIRERMRISGKAKRWDMIPSGYEKTGSLLELLTANTKNESLPQSRLDSDWNRLNKIKEKYGIE